MRQIFAFLFCAMVFGFASTARAQDLASLIADTINVDPAGRVTATGNVDVFYDGTRLNAARVSYARDGDILTITGPIQVTDANGTVFLADQAELDRNLRNGVLISARLVLDQQLQIAANEIARVDGRYTRLDRVVASSCEICAANPIPFWEIRAARVVHDTEERQLYFTNAQLRVIGVPILYLPRLRLPDPTLKRANGFLIPEFQRNSDLGTGFKAPYFLTFGDHADLTLTPFLATETTTLEYQYRQELRGGNIFVEGAFTEDNLVGQRAYLFANAEQRLPRGFLFEAQLEFASDPGYLFTYDFSDQDRLTNQLTLSRVRDKDVFRAEITEFRTLRETEIPIRDTLPDQYLELYYEREIPALAFGGRAVASVSSGTLIRPSSLDILGRDVNRLGASIDWSRGWVSETGVVSKAELGFRVDAYTINQDSTFDSALTRAVPRGALEFRYPLSRTKANGAREVFEPVLRIDVAETGGDDVPLEDSLVVEFDEANLFAPTRFSGVDGIEDGTRLAVGASWSHYNPKGWNMDLAVGRITSLTDDLGFPQGSGLEGETSDWLVSGRLVIGEDLALFSRSLLGDDLDVTLSETRIDWQTERFDLASTYIFAEAEPAEDRLVSLSEWAFEGSLDLTNNWIASADWRYDFNAQRAARAGFGLGYSTECADVTLSLSRRFATSTSVDPTNEIGFRVSLVSSGDRGRGKDGAPGRICRG